MSRDQAESLTRSMTEIMCVNKEKIAEQFVSKASLEKVGLYPFFGALPVTGHGAVASQACKTPSGGV